MTDSILVVDQPITNVVITSVPVPNIVITAPGPQGPAGNVTGVFYTHYQGTPSSTWTVNHNLNNYPVAVVIDSGGTNVEGNVSYPNSNQIILTFSASFGGTAYII